MRSWPAPTVPVLPLRGALPRLKDPRTGVLAELRPGGPAARLYTCGITPYDATHLGHAATYLTVDVLRRCLHAAGVPVVAAQNVTDVDEPLFERAARDGVDWRELGAREIELFRTDMEWLRVIPPEHYTGVEEAMTTVVAAVQRLVDQGSTYRLDAEDATGSKDTYLDLARATGFGDVSRWSRDEMLAVFADRGGDPDRSGKRDPLDPLLWRGERPGEPSYDGGSLGPGRPGWHIECTAIATDHLGCGFDVQAGGSDLVFPHHEMSAVQATAASGPCSFARHYLHQAMVGLDGEKMSKSKGNLVFVHRLREEGADPSSVRAAMLDHHYAHDWSWTREDLHRGVTRLDRWRDAAAHGTEAPPGWTARLLDRVASDLDTPGALRLLDAWAAGAVDLDESGEAPRPADEVVAAADALLGLQLRAE